MIPYQNQAGNSGVVGYLIAPDQISVQFTDGKIYVYTNASAGKANIQQMKKLAKAGKGLSTFISQVVKNNYESKE